MIVCFDPFHLYHRILACSDLGHTSQKLGPFYYSVQSGIPRLSTKELLLLHQSSRSSTSVKESFIVLCDSFVPW